MKEENEKNIQLMTSKLEQIATMQLETQQIEEKLEEVTSELETEQSTLTGPNRNVPGKDRKVRWKFPETPDSSKTAGKRGSRISPGGSGC